MIKQLDRVDLAAYIERTVGSWPGKKMYEKLDLYLRTRHMTDEEKQLYLMATGEKDDAEQQR